MEADAEQSYFCGATNVFAWIAICAGIAIIVPQQIIGMAVSTYFESNHHRASADVPQPTTPATCRRRGMRF